jgi:hypothetical protein
MTELVFWSCIMGFSPMALCIGSRIIANVAKLPYLTASRPQALFCGERLTPDFRRHCIQRAGGSCHGC